ncbi:type VII secretion integral membrane protein EccD [Schumannella sp. 10F1B-5-1]|uniref:type VII secretion integral membrane protein EccD n=1 Tax=Schumannella sp. 10F1B-5-1 TaxID=2590780 RepID=UPI0011322337|nr:type VII secretion integral membrane protein EccD [Schumannella sp. 10F1B-5-1]TPW76750.1 type VII secretion integral membrane protein EccD [Schumannella sp. 10F1B-5-1]
MSSTVSTSRALLRVSIQSEGRRLDVGVPAQLPLIELMPGFARGLGVLDATMTHTGYALQRADGSRLDPSRGAAEQGVLDGELLTLARGVQLAEPRVYDDIVEAVIDATGEQSRPWTPKDNARTALAASLTLLGICAVLLLAGAGGDGPSALLRAIIAGAGAVLLLAAAAVIERLGQVETGRGLALAAAAFGALTGYLLAGAAGAGGAGAGADSPDIVLGSGLAAAALWGWPLAAAGAGAFATGGLAMLLNPASRALLLVPLVLGGAIGVTATIAALMPDSRQSAYALMVAIVITLANALPWLALTSTRIRVISPQSDQEIFDDPEPIDAEAVRARAAAGHRVLVALRLALGLAALIGAPLVAASGPAGAALCALGFVGIMMPARQAFARAEVVVLMSMGTIGIAVTGVAATLAQPDLRVVLLVVLLSVTVIVIALTLLAPGARMRLIRLADTVEIITIALLLPLGVIAAGLAWA